MEERCCNNKYTIYHDESNNFRSLKINGNKYNIDNDPNQKSSPIFITAGIAKKENDVDFDGLISELNLQKTCRELKFAQLVKLKASYKPEDAFKATLGSKGIQTILKWLFDNDIYIHCRVIDVAYWAFLDIIEDLIITENDYRNQFYYKDCLYKLINLDKDAFLSLMSNYGYPNISKETSLLFLIDIKIFSAEWLKKLNNSDDLFDSIYNFDTFLLNCLIYYKDNEELDFLLVRDEKKNILVEDFGFFYFSRMRTFPNSTHIFDKEKNIEKIMQEDAAYKEGLNNIDFKFSESHLKENFPIQIADVISRFIYIFHNYVNVSSLSDVKIFKSNLNQSQKMTLHLFSENFLKSVDECHLFQHRVIAPSDEEKAKFLLFE